MLVCLAFEHHTVDFDFLGAIERHTEPVVAALADPALTHGSVVLATCNRFEAYLDVASVTAVDQSISRVSEITGIDKGALAKRLQLHTDRDAIEHLFSVAGGLESVVIGEGEIGGQVRRALEQARDLGNTTSELERLFQFAARTSRRIKHQTGVQTAGRSLVRLGLSMAQSRIGDWSTARVVLVGTGAYAGASLAALRARGANHVAVFSHSGRAEGFAASHNISAVTETGLADALAEADLIITTTLAKEPVLRTELLSRTQRPARGPYCETITRRSSSAASASAVTTVTSVANAQTSASRPRLIIDLGVPRNVERAAALVPGVEVIDLDLIAKHAPIAELSAEAEARGIVRDAVDEFSALSAEQDAMPALVALRKHVYSLLDEELQRFGPWRTESPDNTATDDASANNAARQRAQTEAALRHFAGRLLHRPSIRIRKSGRDGNAAQARAAVELLFDVQIPRDESPVGQGR